MPDILVTNDDGIDAPGLAALAAALADLGRVVVVAPVTEQSGCSHAMSLHRPLRVRSVGPDRYAVEGTPTDCVNLAVFHLMRHRRPALVASGINPGYNLGDDVTYSGTVGGALEAALLDLPALAVSRSPEVPIDFTAAARIARQVAGEILGHGLPRRTLLNLNVPAGEPAGLRMTRQGSRVYAGGVFERTDPKGRAYFWIGAEKAAAAVAPGTDLAAVERGEVSVTPLCADWTADAALELVAGWDLPFAAGSAR